MIALYGLTLLIAIALVVKSADWFLGAAEKIGTWLKLPQFIMGVVLVGFGTSLPELSTSIAAINNGEHTVTIANVIGSNLANILIIIGISTLALGTIRFDKNLIDLDIPFLTTIVLLFSFLLVDGELSFTDGLILLIGLVGYLMYSLAYREDPRHHSGVVQYIKTLLSRKKKATKSKESKTHVTPLTWFTLVISIVLLAVASNVAIDSMLKIVSEIGVAVSILSFFALAMGTSLPELIVSIKSLKKGKSDIVLGNIIGSCMFNMLLIGGVSAVLHPQFIEPQIAGWAIAGLVASTLILAISAIGKRIHIWEGFAYLLLYVAISIKIMNF